MTKEDIQVINKEATSRGNKQYAKMVLIFLLTVVMSSLASWATRFVPNYSWLPFVRLIGAYLIVVFVVGPINAGFSKAALQLGFSDNIDGCVMDFMRGEKYIKAVQVYALYYAVTYFPLLISSLGDMFNVGILRMVALPFILISMYFFIFEFTLIDVILADRPDIGTINAFKLSMKMMKGNKGHYFSLIFSFTVWIIVSIVTCLVGLIFFVPYLRCANACFYEKIRDELGYINPDEIEL